MQAGKKFGVWSSEVGVINPKSNGFTLIEIVITISLIGIISGIAAMIILQGVRGYSDEQSRSDVHYQARIAMERMAREIRLIRSQGADISAMADNNLRFIDVTGAATGFSWANPVLSRWNGVSNDLLATGVTAFDFDYFQQDGATPAAAANLWLVEITMTATAVNGETLSLRTRVHPRNF